MNVVFLVIDYMPHQLVLINSLIKQEEVKVYAFSLKESKILASNGPNLVNFNLKDFSRPQFLAKLIEINPKMMAVAGWAVNDYVWASKKLRHKLNIPVVAYSDSQWRGTLRQKINSILSPWHIQLAFSHVWVAGIYQYEYARKLGYKKNQIVYNSLSCDLELFRNVPLAQKKKDYPKNFLFVGRFVHVKGLESLIEAWKKIKEKNGWSLTLIGDGPLKENFQSIDGVNIKNSMSQDQLTREFENSGCFILPSFFEQWALVLHEAAAAGLPIIATEECGSVPHFLISGWNGLKIKSEEESIRTALERIIRSDSAQLFRFASNSKILAESITPEQGVAQLMSILNN